MRLTSFENMNAIHAKLTKASEGNLPADERRGAYIAGDDPVELRPVRRLTATSKPSMPGIKGGQGRAGVEVEEDARELLVVLGLSVAVLLGIGCAELIANAADAFGAAYLAN